MFKMPEKERLNDIVDMIPEMVAVLGQTGKGYSARISKMGEMMRLHGLMSELNISLPLPPRLKDPLYFVEIAERNEIPSCALVIASSGRYRLAFSEDEESCVVTLTRKFGNECINGQIYIYSNTEVSKRDIKRMKSSGAESYYHINTKKCMFL